jgi:hypothetical protein
MAARETSDDAQIYHSSRRRGGYVAIRGNRAAAEEYPAALLPYV